MHNATRLLVLVAFAGLAALIGIVALPDDEQDPPAKHIYVEQEQTERIWTEQALTLAPLRYPIYEALFNPVLMKRYDDNLYIVDHGDTRIKRFSLHGALINTIGMGKGEGPGEFGNITDFYVRKETIWVASPRSRTILKFHIDGTYLSQFDAHPVSFRVTGLKENLVLMKLMSPALLHETDTTGTAVRTFGEVIMEQTQNPLALDGTFVDDEDGGFIYVPTYASYLYFYDASGTLDKVVQTIDRLPFPGTASRNTETTLFAPKTDIVINNASLYDGALYLHTKFVKEETEGGRLSILDRYDAQTGAYVNSTRLPFAALNAVVYGERLYCLHDTTVSVLQFEP